MGADVRPLEARPVVDPDPHAAGGTEDLYQARVRLEVLLRPRRRNDNERLRR